MNYALTMCWKIVKKLIDERTSHKFNFISGEDDIKELVLTKIHPSQLEKRFGGNAEIFQMKLIFHLYCQVKNIKLMIGIIPKL